MVSSGGLAELASKLTKIAGVLPQERADLMDTARELMLHTEQMLRMVATEMVEKARGAKSKEVSRP